MIITYEDFKKSIDQITVEDDDFYYKLLQTVIDNPNRYTGIFRLSNARTKMIQNVTQSREIRFGDFMEQIMTQYISKMGYINLDKTIHNNGNTLSFDQLFKKGNTIYIIEQKIRDDHDSTKKRGQYSNFKEKYMILSERYPDYTVVASMWFIDDSLQKNKRFYLDEIEKKGIIGIERNIFYGGEIFASLFERPDVWEEICDYLVRNKKERDEEIINIPSFDTSEEMFNALDKLRRTDARRYNKLLSNHPNYIELRKELFPTGRNLNLLN